jgi:hypothetical protein
VNADLCTINTRMTAASLQEKVTTTSFLLEIMTPIKTSI